MKRINDLKPKQRLQYLVVGILLLTALAWFGTIKHTKKLYHQYTKNTAILEQVGQAPKRIRQLKNNLDHYTNAFDKRMYDRATLFESINIYCDKNKVIIKDFKPEEQKDYKEYSIITNPITLEGNYIDIVGLAYELEYKNQLGHIASMKFDRKINRRTKEVALEATLFTQHLSE